MKYYKHDKIRQYERIFKGNKSLLTPKQRELFEYARRRGYLVERNDAARNGKAGLYYEVARYFDDARLRERMYAEERRAQRDAKRRAEVLKKACDEVLPAEDVDWFETISDTGSFKIDGKTYSNFYGDGDNSVEVRAVDFDAFKKADKITRRQVYNAQDPITIAKFDAPKTINVSLSDVDESAGAKTIDNVCGFAIWSRKLKIFVAKDGNGCA